METLAKEKLSRIESLVTINEKVYNVRSIDFITRELLEEGFEKEEIKEYFIWLMDLTMKNI